MIPDTSQIKAAVAVLQTNPSWALVLLLLVGGAGVAFAFLLLQLFKNTEITKAIAERIGDKTHDQNIEKMASTLENIRSDQVVSNQERREQGKQILDIDQRLTEVEYNLLNLTRWQRSMPPTAKDPV
jgi:hypothetical protein